MSIKKEIDTILQEDDFKPTLFKMLGYEGGYTESDGTPTNYGVNQTTFDSYMKQKGKETKSVKELNAGDVVNFYRDTFWKGSRANEMEEPLRTVYFDGSVNMGVPNAVKQLQKIVGTKVDGKYGKKTEAKVKEFIEKHGAKALAGQVIDKRKDHYDTMVTNNPAKHKKHYQGWLNRINKLRGEYVGDGLIHFPKTDTMRPMASGMTVLSPEWMRNWQESFPDMGDKIAREQAEGYPSPIMPPSMEQEGIPDRGDEIAEEIAKGYPSPVTYDPKPEDLAVYSTGEGKVGLVDIAKQNIDTKSNFTMAGDTLTKELSTRSDQEIIDLMKWSREQSPHTQRNIEQTASAELRSRGVTVDEIKWQVKQLSHSTGKKSFKK
jgi:lysozyme family protein